MNQKSNQKRSKVSLLFLLVLLIVLGFLAMKFLKSHAATPEPVVLPQQAIINSHPVREVNTPTLKEKKKTSPEEQKKQGRLNKLYNNKASTLALAKIDTALLAEAANQAQLKVAITQSNVKVGELTAPPKVIPSSVEPPLAKKETSVKIETKLNWIAKRANSWVASIRQSNGRSIIVGEGERIFDGSTVKKIDKNSVILAKDDKEKRLELSEI